MKCSITVESIGYENIMPKECIGRVFCNKNGKFSRLTNMEDIQKAAQYFGAMPQYVHLTNSKGVILASDNAKLGLPRIPPEAIEEFIYRDKVDFELVDFRDIEIATNTNGEAILM